MIIDFHVHIFPPHIKADRSPYLARDSGFRSLYQSPRARIATVEELIVSMDSAGIDVSVVQGFAWSSQELCVETNDYIQDAAARYPKRLIPFCTVQPLAGTQALEEVRRRATSANPCRGLGEMRPDDQGYGGDDWKALEPLYELSMRHRLLLLVHGSEPVGHLYPGKGRMTPDVLYRLALAYPEWPMVLAHLGGGLPFYAAMPEVRKALANVYVDTAAWPLLYAPEVFPAVADLFGPERVLFASDYPVMDQTRALEGISKLSLPSETLRGILGGNAERLLGFATRLVPHG